MEALAEVAAVECGPESPEAVAGCSDSSRSLPGEIGELIAVAERQPVHAVAEAAAEAA